MSNNDANAITRNLNAQIRKMEPVADRYENEAECLRTAATVLANEGQADAVETVERLARYAEVEASQVRSRIADLCDEALEALEALED